MTVSMDQANGNITVRELNVSNVEGVYYSKELTALKERLIPLADVVHEARKEYLKALYDVEQANYNDVKAVEAKEAELVELSESKAGVLVAAELMAINKAEKELKEEIAATKEINVSLAENRKVIYEDKADAVFTAVETYLPVLNEIRAEYEDTKSNRTAAVYDKELNQFTAVYRNNGAGTFVSLKNKIQPVWSNGSGERRFGHDNWRDHSMQTYSRM